MPPSDRRLSLLSYALAIMALAWLRPGHAGEVAVVMSEEAAIYREVADTIRSQLADAAAVSVMQPGGIQNINRKELRYLVAIGTQAAQAALASDLEAPLLVTLLPQSAFERLIAEKRRGGAPRPISAVFLDQPIDRQLDLIRLALPNAKRIGVLLGPESAKQLPQLQSEAAERHMRISAQHVDNEKELAVSLQKLLPESDVLLALPDPAVFNAGTIQLILLASYRQQLPLFGFSAAYARAGAIASLHSTPAQIGLLAAEMLRAGLANGQLPPPRHPNRYTVATNPHVARSLGIPLDSEQSLMQRMRALDVR